MSILINIASEFTGKKAFKEADTAVGRLNKAVKGLGLGFAVSTAAATAFAKASVNAFIADEAAASKLSLAVKNLGMEFANPYITQYIADMEAMTKVADDDLRPAFQALLTTTGSLAASQSALSTAIEVSRGTGIDLATVSNDLAQAYIGNTKGLKKYYLGLSNAALAGKSFTEIQKIMNDQFAGSSAAYLSTYSGQVGVLSLAWGNFQEKVGGTLLTLASFGDGSEGAKLNILAATLDKIGSAIELIGKGKEAIFGLFDITGKNGLLSKFNPTGIPTGGSASSQSKPEDPYKQYKKLLDQIEADRKKQNAAVLAAQKKLTAEQKKQALAKKQSALFDMEQIQIIAALKGKISEEDKLRLNLQLALLTGNEAQAKKLSDQLADSIDKTGKLKQYINTLPEAPNPFKAWDEWLATFKTNLSSVLALSPSAPGAGLPATSGLDFGGNKIGSPVPNFTPPSSGTYGTASIPPVVVQIDGKTIASALMDQSLSGNQAYVNRRTGGFE